MLLMRSAMVESVAAVLCGLLGLELFAQLVLHVVLLVICSIHHTTDVFSFGGSPVVICLACCASGHLLIPPHY